VRSAKTLLLRPKANVDLVAIERAMPARFGLQFSHAGAKAELLEDYRYILRNVAVWGE